MKTDLIYTYFFRRPTNIHTVSHPGVKVTRRKILRLFRRRRQQAFIHSDPTVLTSMLLTRRINLKFSQKKSVCTKALIHIHKQYTIIFETCPSLSKYKSAKGQKTFVLLKKKFFAFAIHIIINVHGYLSLCAVVLSRTYIFVYNFYCTLSVCFHLGISST